MMEYTNNDEIIKRYPYLKEACDYTIFTTINDVFELNNSRKVFLGIDKCISYDVIKRILNDDVYFKYALKLFRGTIDRLNISCVADGNVGTTISYDKLLIINGLEWLINIRKEEITEQEQERYNRLQKELSFVRFKECSLGETYKTTIDGNEYDIKVEDMIKFLELSKSDLKRVYRDKKGFIDGVPIRHFLFAIVEYFTKNEIAKNYILPNNVLETLNDLKRDKTIDLLAINKYLTTTDTLQRKIELNKEVENAILGGMPEGLNTLEKAIYIYIKMCKIFTYDDEFFAMSQKGKSEEKHKNIEYVKDISLTNNKVVCWEFNIIYAYFLETLGLNFKSIYTSREEGYGYGHVDLVFRYDKYLIKADSVESILKSDLTLAKINKSLKGLEPLNKNEESKREFESTVWKIQKLVLKQERGLDDEEFSNKLIYLLQEYSVTTSNIRKVSIEERLDILRERIGYANLKGMDTFTYIFLIRRALFGNEIARDKFAISILRSNKPLNGNEYSESIGVIVVNENGVKNSLSNKYYIINATSNTITTISREELQGRFDDGTYELVENIKSIVPGIDAGGKKL